MKKVLIIHQSNGLGLHFLDWSINFLSGQECVPAPLLGTTAHQHHPHYIRHADQLHPDLPLVIHAIGPSFYDLACEQGIQMSDTNENWHKKASGTILREIDRIIERTKHDRLPVMIDWHREHWLIPSYAHRYPLDYTNNAPTSKDQVMDSYLKAFFPGSETKWTSQYPWDERERLALNLRPVQLSDNLAASLAHTHSDCYCSDTKSLWFDLPRVLRSIFSACDLSFDPLRLMQWQDTYARWQTMHDVKFSQDYWAILDCIVQGRTLDLSGYQIDFIKEALLQHGLIYRHDLNLRSWQVHKLPSDAVLIHALLEPNQHPRDFSYTGAV